MNWIKKTALAALMTSTLALGAWKMEGGSEVEIGDIIPMMMQQMEDVSGKKYHLRELHQENGLLVIFSCNTCPFVLQWEDRYNELYDLCKANNMGMVLINSNEAKRSGDDSIEKMREKAKAEGYKMPYVVDKDHMVADAFGARTTPHVFLFDRDAKLAYRGAIDDNAADKDAVQYPYLQDAIRALVAGKEFEPNVTKATGCSIKRVQQ
jgi:peroxiredoxin